VGSNDWETLSPTGGYRQDRANGRVGTMLGNADETVTVSAKLRTEGDAEGFVHIKLRFGAGTPDERWTRIVVDSHRNIVAQGYGDTEQEAYEDALDVLAAKGFSP
jgi:hypothetical protein